MKERERLNGRRAISPVISAVILSAAVLTVGCSIWFFSQGAMTITAENYAEAVINMTDTISERFIVEQVAYIDTNLKVWIYNYGTVDIEVKVEVNSKTYPNAEDEWIKIPSKEMKPFPNIVLETTPLPKEELNIKAYTRRGNDAYYRFIVP